MDRHKLIRQFVDFIFGLILAVVAFYIGKTVGTITTESKYKSKYMELSLEQDTIQLRMDTLKKTYKEIKASPCFKK